MKLLGGRMHHKKEQGYGSTGVLVIFAILLVVWFIFNTILGYIGSNHSKKVAQRKKMWADRAEAKKPKVKVKRKVNGYQVSY